MRRIGLLALAMVIALVLPACREDGGDDASVSANATQINGITVPPDPGPQGDATLAGIDTNANGVRDDVERKIAAKYGASINQFDGAMRVAKSMQMGVLANGDPTASSAATVAEFSDGACINSRFEENAIAAEQAINDVFIYTMNSMERLAAYKAKVKAAQVENFRMPDQPCL